MTPGLLHIFLLSWGFFPACPLHPFRSCCSASRQGLGLCIMSCQLIPVKMLAHVRRASWGVVCILIGSLNMEELQTKAVNPPWRRDRQFWIGWGWWDLKQDQILLCMFWDALMQPLSRSQRLNEMGLCSQPWEQTRAAVGALSAVILLLCVQI